MVKDLINNVICEKVEKFVEGKVSFYWEHESENMPVIEVFIHGNSTEVYRKMLEVEMKVRAKSISDNKASIHIEKLENNYYRIMIYMDFDIMKERDLFMLVSILKKYGSYQWEDVKK